MSESDDAETISTFLSSPVAFVTRTNTDIGPRDRNLEVAVPDAYLKWIRIAICSWY